MSVQWDTVATEGFHANQSRSGQLAPPTLIALIMHNVNRTGFANVETDLWPAEFCA